MKTISEFNNFKKPNSLEKKFQLLIEILKNRQLEFLRPEDLLDLDTHRRGASFRYDIHVRDIANAYAFVQEHSRQGIPGVFFLQIDYSLAERQRVSDFVELARFATESGLQVGLHSSPVDSYFIWKIHDGNARSYANWLREYGEQHLTALASEPNRLKAFNADVGRHFAESVEQAKQLIGPFDLIASHGGELGQILRPRVSAMAPAVANVFKDLLANNWMTKTRLVTVGIKVDVQQILTKQLLQVTDRGGGYDLMLDSLRRISPSVNVQVLIHPYGWGAFTMVSQKNIIDISTNLSPDIIQSESLPLKTQSVEILDRSAHMLVNMAPPGHECKSACSRVHEKWVSWFQHKFKNVEEKIDDALCSVPRIPLAVIETTQTEAEYLKLIGDKSRNMLRKAMRNGYTVRVFDSAQHLDDIYAIRTSKEIRSGKPVPDNFKEYPLPFDKVNNNLCDSHKIIGVGVFKGETKLVGYAALHNCGELSIINTILGHGEHLKFGVMNLLVFGAFKEIRGRFPSVKYINYLTLRSSTKQLDTFKKSVGFVPREICLRLASCGDAEVLKTVQTGEIKSTVALQTLALVDANLPQSMPSIILSLKTQPNNPIADLIERKAFRKILIRGDCCSIRAVARNPELFGKPELIQNEKCTMEVYLDHLQGISYPDDALASLSNLDDMPPSLRRYYINQNKADVLTESGADLLVVDSYADSFFQLWQNKRTKAKLWVNAKFLHDRSTFEREHIKLPRRTFHEVLIDTKRFIEHVRRNNPDLPVLYLTHPIHYYRYLNSRREFCYLGEELERFISNVYWGTHLPKEVCEPVDMNSCGPGETHHYTPQTYAKMILAAAARSPVRTEAEVVW